MRLSLNLYDALTSISVPNDKAKAVVDAWEADVQQLASKSDLERTEARLEHSIAELRSDLTTLIKEQGAEIREQGVVLNTALREQRTVLSTALQAQGTELRALIERQGSQFEGAVTKLESSMTLLRWQFWLLLICIGFPILKGLYEAFGVSFIS
ncbi:DUF1640 domain-containing protein [Pseudomonas nabeulensis]|uniref:DUF1640 domain-containing protein n=1 Tax=Pseudomonas nabeulensis TaxID=2293833 RepID=A0A4Z0B239_9PSED|nr:DUF1640 domain-containing protein [Pseudomonas nabeulensis]TFY93152.1 DUF1640 domain-containing protein [Pseudomonas nabeulensis]